MTCSVSFHQGRGFLQEPVMLAVVFLSLRWREFWLVRAGWWVGLRHNVQDPASVQRALPPLAPQVFGFCLGWPSKGKSRWPVSSDLWPLKSHSWHALLFGEEWEQWKYSHPTLPRPLDVKTPWLDFFFLGVRSNYSQSFPCAALPLPGSSSCQKGSPALLPHQE